MTRPGTGSLVGLLALGLLLAGLCLAGAMLVMGMGHGWGWPLRHAVLPFLFYSLVLGLHWGATRRASPRERWPFAVGGAILLTIGLGLDLSAWAGFNGTTDWAGSARAYPGVVVPWLVFWLGWQAAAATLLWYAIPRPNRA